MIPFENTEVAFRMKTTNDLRQSKLLFSTLSSPKTVGVLKGLTLFSLGIHLPIKGIIKRTVFRQFCGGETVEQCDPQVARLAEGRVKAILDYSVEGKAQEADFDRTLRTTLQTVENAAGHADIPFGVFKPTGLGPIELYEKVSLGEPLSSEEQTLWTRVKARWAAVFESGAKHGVPVLVDAEESWIQPALDDLLFEFMAQYNTERAMIYNTAQMYRRDRLDQLQHAYQRAVEGGFHYGVKIVRGAYMEKERARAKEMGYPDPINPTKAATDELFDAATTFILERLDRMAVLIGTHNEQSVQHAAQEMGRLHIATNDPRVYIAQLFGMSDHISFNAAAAGLNAAKYLPFGPVADVMPYLFRRAEENTSVEGQTGRELGLIQRELNRRRKA